jgi:hypothetical protein
MTSEEKYSFTFDRKAAGEVFQQIGVRDLVLAVLAGVIPRDQWEGCTVYEGPTPADPARTACVATVGPAADEVQVALVEAFERFGIPVSAIFEGGPVMRQLIARCSCGRWVTPE